MKCNLCEHKMNFYIDPLTKKPWYVCNYCGYRIPYWE